MALRQSTIDKYTRFLDDLIFLAGTFTKEEYDQAVERHKVNGRAALRVLCFNNHIKEEGGVYTSYNLPESNDADMATFVQRVQEWGRSPVLPEPTPAKQQTSPKPPINFEKIYRQMGDRMDEIERKIVVLKEGQALERAKHSHLLARLEKMGEKLSDLIRKNGIEADLRLKVESLWQDRSGKMVKLSDETEDFVVALGNKFRSMEKRFVHLREDMAKHKAPTYYVVTGVAAAALALGVVIGVVI